MKKRNKKIDKKNRKRNNKDLEESKKKKDKFSKRHPKLIWLIRIILILFILLAVVATGIVVGMVYCGWGDDFEIKKEELVIEESNSVVLDLSGNVIAELSGDQNRTIVSLSEMSEYLPKAYISTEDERFYQHDGVDLKRTTAAIASFVTHAGSSSFGGSTITQQLVKNITKDDDDSGFDGMLRKVKEWAKAYQIEKMLSKDQILELYLNIIFVGGKNAGVEAGSRYYFNKKASDLTIAECAFLAGINKGPNLYNPYGENGYNENENKKKKINTRAKTVLEQMKKQGYITDEQLNEANAQIDEGYKFEKGYDQGSIYSYHTDATISKVIKDIAEKKGISQALAKTYVYSSGLTIYSTQNTDVQNSMNSVMVDDGGKYMKKSAKGTDENGNEITSQASMAVIDNETGYVVGIVGGLGEKTESRGLNRAVQSVRQTGSSIKPLTSLIPGINEGYITPATIYDDCSTLFLNGTYPPKDYNTPKGLISIRSATMSSQNIPFVKVVSELTPEKAKEYLEKMGVTSINSKDGLAALSIGGFTDGISSLEMAAAYGTIANDGVYRTPLLYTKVTDKDGNVVIEPEQRTEQVFTQQTAYVVKDILKSVVQAGTATYCKISGIDVAAKTGSTNNYYDRWLCGFTNYYSGATWYGYDDPEEVKGETNWAGQIWSSIMKNIHSGLDSSRFEKPEGIVSAKICKTSGKRATDKCTDTYQEIFVEGKVPGECDAHSNSAQICNETGLLANEYCTDVSTQYFSYTVEKERLGLWENKTNSVKEAPTTYCTTHNLNNTKKEFKAPKITLNGSATITLTVGDKYEEQGVKKASDEIDGDLTKKVTIDKTAVVNTEKAGTYEIKYTVTNSKGKTATATRTIIVKAKEEKKDTTTQNKENTTKDTGTTAKESDKKDTTQNTTTNNTTATNTTKQSKENKTN